MFIFVIKEEVKLVLVDVDKELIESNLKDYIFIEIKGLYSGSERRKYRG